MFSLKKKQLGVHSNRIIKFTLMAIFIFEIINIDLRISTPWQPPPLYNTIKIRNVKFLITKQQKRGRFMTLTLSGQCNTMNTVHQGKLIFRYCCTKYIPFLQRHTMTRRCRDYQFFVIYLKK